MIRQLLPLLLTLAVCSCTPQGIKPPPSVKLQVVATIFPVYDFVRAIGGDRVAVSMLLPPGTEPHSFEPKPADMMRVGKARLFVFTNPAMEPWAGKLLAGASGKVQAVDASAGITLMPVDTKRQDQHDDHGHGAADPHLWLDFDHARQMVTTIAGAMATADPAGATLYAANAATYQQKLIALDARFRLGLADCSSRTLLQGGHAAFGYLAARYNLASHAAMGVAANAEATPRQLTALVDELRHLSVKTVFSEELVSPRLAETLALDAGATVLRLNAAHTVGREDLQAGVTYLSLMEKNLATLRTGLACR